MDDDNRDDRKKSYGENKIMKFILKMLLKILLSPFIIFIGAYIYYDQDLRKGVLVALLFYSVLTAISIILKIIGIFTSMATFNPIKLIKRSFDLLIMLSFLLIYWLIYSLSFAGDYSL